MRFDSCFDTGGGLYCCALTAFGLGLILAMALCSTSVTYWTRAMVFATLSVSSHFLLPPVCLIPSAPRAFSSSSTVSFSLVHPCLCAYGIHYHCRIHKLPHHSLVCDRIHKHGLEMPSKRWMPIEVVFSACFVHIVCHPPRVCFV
jgi:hypothetical protein